MKSIINKITNWEQWNFKLLYAPLAPVWLWYCLKMRSVWFFAYSNPKITFGGMDGETKMEIYKLLPQNLYPETFLVKPSHDFKSIIENIEINKIKYPFIVKPDVGKQGVLFRLIKNEAELKNYHSKMPVDYLIQQKVDYPFEVSVFHIKKPWENTGIITGFLHKIPLNIIGDGIHTVGQLTEKHPKATTKLEELKIKHSINWNNILPQGEKYMLSYAANHNRGAHFIDLKKYITPEFTSFFDKLSIEANDLFYGRYDILCKDIDSMVQGKNFKILEYNGCGAEPNHFYDTGYTLIGAYREILKHWKALYLICKYNKQNGVKSWSFAKGRKFLNDFNTVFNKLKIIDKELI
ncbi:MAG: hypothetical protein HUU47_02945 [Bacteroidetes bacterium]|nr:hypothetical protein [Bacteroidota bacterium]